MYYTNRANTTNFSQTFFQDNSDTNTLRVGTNVIAIQVFNVHADDFDFFINPELSLTLTDVTPPTVLSVTPAPGTVAHLEEITVTFSEAVTGVGVEDLLVNAQQAISMTGTNATYTFGFPPVPAGTAHDSPGPYVDRSWPRTRVRDPSTMNRRASKSCVCGSRRVCAWISPSPIS